jgi:hypothetical protein
VIADSIETVDAGEENARQRGSSVPNGHHGTSPLALG